MSNHEWCNACTYVCSNNAKIHKRYCPIVVNRDCVSSYHHHNLRHSHTNWISNWHANRRTNRHFHTLQLSFKCMWMQCFYVCNNNVISNCYKYLQRANIAHAHHVVDAPTWSSPPIHFPSRTMRSAIANFMQWSSPRKILLVLLRYWYKSYFYFFE